MATRKIVLKNHLSPGDIVMLTAAVRDLHKLHPREFLTDVRTTAKGLWKHNPYITSLNPDSSDVETVDCHYPLIHQSNQLPYHFIHGFIKHLGDTLGVEMAPTAFKGDIHLSKPEKRWVSQVQELTKDDRPFWIIVSGGKNDFTIKWWDSKRYQQVVDHFQGRIQFVQVGESNHYHPPLNGVIDLRGKTNIRQLVRLMHHAQGVVCPVTFLMHLAAAVETKPGMPAKRPCVVIAGGREPVHWEAYSHHQFLHTQGALSCCQKGGCWKSRTKPLNDGDPKDRNSLCVDVVGNLPRCMDMIRTEDVIRAIERYFEGGVVSYWNPKSALSRTCNSGQQSQATPHIHRSNGNGKNRNKIEIRFVGLRRSGIHAVTNWLASLLDGPACYINDISHQTKIRRDHQSDPLPVLADHPHRAVGISDNKELLIIGYEDERLLNIKNSFSVQDLLGQSARRIDILLLRDPYNTFASRLHLKRERPRNPFVKDFLNPVPAGNISLPTLWKRYAREYLNQSNHLTHSKVVINYNQWLVDPDYRNSLCHQLQFPNRKGQVHRVPSYGFGSSFDRQAFDRRATSMALLDRWKHFVDDSEYRALFDPEVHHLACKIFPDLKVSFKSCKCCTKN